MDNTLRQSKVFDKNTRTRTLSAVVIFLFLGIAYLLGSFAIHISIFLITGVMLFEIWSIDKYKKRFSLLMKVFFSCYVLISMLCFKNLYNEKGILFVLWMILTVSSNDTAAYFIGRFFKGKKLAPTISPGKTWSGFIGGMIVGTTVSYTSQPFLIEKIFTPFWCFLISLSSHGGDLFESAFKRYFDIKDTSSLIPGHGGVMDRLDAILGVSLFIYMLFLCQ
jgi:phosphatidate cytidylyltransferase